MNLSDPVRQKLSAAPYDFRFAILFAPRDQRPALAALFAVYLEIREILTECRDADVARAKIGWWQEEIGLFFEQRPRHPLSQNLVRLTDIRTLSVQHFLAIIEGMAMDIAVPWFPHFEDLERYCFQRGGALMELAARLAGARQPVTLETARRLGNAWQLADLVARTHLHIQHGRVYFAADDLYKYSVDRDKLDATHISAGLKALMEDYVRRARAFMHATAADSRMEGRTLRSSWVLAGLSMARSKKFLRHDFTRNLAPVELQPFAALSAAWRSARHATH